MPNAASQGPPEPAPDPLLGRTLGGHYKIEARIGGGAMGVVYRARHTLLDQVFAVKVLAQGVGADSEVRRRFLLEAKSLTLFTHKHAVQVRHLGEDDGLLYLAMDLVPGDTLAAVLETTGALPEARAAAIALQILDALEEAHKAGIVHRDLKPGNVMVETRRGDGIPAGDRVHVLDFGLARIIDAERAALPAAFASTGGEVVGTVAYMSPEQLRADDDVDGRSDLFSVGVVLYEMLTGRLPFEGKSTMSIALGILEKAPTPFEATEAANVSAPMQAVISRALEKSRDQRYATAAEFAAGLRAALRGISPPPAPVPAPAPGSGPRPARSGSRRPRSLLFALGIWTLVAAGLASLLFVSWSDPSAKDRATGREAMLDGRFADAAEAYGRIVSTGKATAEDRLDRAEARIELMEPDAASDIEAARAVAPKNPRVSLLEARLAWRHPSQPDFVRAASALERALFLDPSLEEALVERVRMRVASGHPEDAKGDLALLRADPRNARGEWLSSLVTISTPAPPTDPTKATIYPTAVEEARKATALDARDAEAWEQLAGVLTGDGLRARAAGDPAASRAQLADAEKAATECIERAKANRGYRRQGRWIGRFHIDRAMVRSQMEDYEGGKQDIDEVLKRAPNDPRARGLQLFAMRFIDHEAVIRDAERLFQASGKAEPLFDIGFARQMMGVEKADVGDVRGAIEAFGLAIDMYTKGIALAPSRQDFPTYRGETLVLRARLESGVARESDLDAAQTDFARAIIGVSGNSETLLRRSALYALRGDTENALKDIEAAVGKDMGKTPRFYQEMARALLAQAEVERKAGKMEEARAHAARALPILDLASGRTPAIEVRLLPLRATAHARGAALAESPPDRDRQADLSLLQLRRIETEITMAKGTEAARLRAALEFAHGELEFARDEAADAATKAVEAARRAISIREAENAAGRWSLDGAWYDRLADYLDAAGKPDEAKAAREKAATLPR